MGAIRRGPSRPSGLVGILLCGESSMRRATLAVVLGWAGMAVLAVMALGAAEGWIVDRAVAAESATAPAEKGADPAAAPAQDKPAAAKGRGAKAGQLKGRLPPYFSAVVTPELREKIYAIQAEYDPKISQLRKELEALTKARDEKIYALLTPEQKKKIEDLKAAARSPKKKQAGEAK